MKLRFQGAFSLIELLVVVALVVVLMALMQPVILRMMRQSRLVACSSNLRQVSSLVLQHAMDHQATLPRWNAGRLPVAIGSPPAGGEGTNQNPPWMHLLVLDGLITETNPAWKCPADVSPNSRVSYTINTNVAGHKLANIPRQAETILLSERYDPNSTRLVVRVTYAGTPNSTGIRTDHGGKAAISYVDGHVELLPYSTKTGQLLPPDSAWVIKN